MELLETYKKLVKSRYFSIAPIAIAVISIFSQTRSLLDQHSDIILSGASWLKDHAILYAQVWSSHSPQTLYFGYIYNRYLSESFWQYAFELLFFLLAFWLLRQFLKLLQPKKDVQSNLLLLFTALITVPGVWSFGLSDQKLGFIFLVAMYFAYYSWKNSKKSYWVLGETSKNWRFMLLAGISFSLLINTSILYSVFFIPILVDFIKSNPKKWDFKLKWSALFYIPAIVEAWVWLSYLSSRNLFRLFIDAILVNIREQFGSRILSTSLPLIIFGALLLIIALTHSSASQFKKNTLRWVTGILIVFSLVFATRFVILSVIFGFFVMVLLYKRQAQVIIKANLIGSVALSMIVLSIPLTILRDRREKLAIAEVDLASAYIQQRQIESNTVIYYGLGAGFYERTGLQSSSRFVNLGVLEYDNESSDLGSFFRGDSEGSTPMFLAYSTNEYLKMPLIPRIKEYISKHYQKTAEIDGFDIYKRKN